MVHSWTGTGTTWRKAHTTRPFPSLLSHAYYARGVIVFQALKLTYKNAQGYSNEPPCSATLDAIPGSPVGSKGPHYRSAQELKPDAIKVRVVPQLVARTPTSIRVFFMPWALHRDTDEKFWLPSGAPTQSGCYGRPSTHVACIAS